MTCSSNTICRPERRLARTLLLAGVLAAALLARSSPSSAASSAVAGNLILEAKEYLSRGDGIAAEVRLKEALGKGASRKSVAAYMGEALLEQDQPFRARKWLEAGEFTPSSAQAGYSALARLEWQDGRFGKAADAYDRALVIAPKDPELWVEIGRFRYAGGEHLLAIEASDHALRLDPENVRALELRGQFVRDRDGLAPSLEWFRKAHEQAPGDISVMGEYAATLGDMGQTVRMLALTRQMLDLDPGNPRAYYLQAVMAARAGRYKLARNLLRKTEGKLTDVPGAMLLQGVVEIAAGNYTLGVEALDPLVRMQPGNERARNLLARALFLSGDYRYLADRFAAAASGPDASPYLQVLVARALENIGKRDRAAPLLDSASQFDRRPVYPIATGTLIGNLLAQGRTDEAEAATRQWLAENPGYFDHYTLAGDVQLVLGRGREAMAQYANAARIRMPESLMARRFQAMLMAGEMEQAVALVEGYRRNNPSSREAIRLTAWLAAYSGDWPRARRFYEYLRDNGGERDVQLLSDLALTQVRAGDAAAGEETARRAYRLQRSSPVAAQAWGLALVAKGTRKREALALLDKARAMMGDTPLLAEGRLKLASIR